MNKYFFTLFVLASCIANAQKIDMTAVDPLEAQPSNANQVTIMPVYLGENAARQYTVTIIQSGESQIVKIQKEALIKEISDLKRQVPKSLKEYKSDEISLDELIKFGFWCQYDEENLKINIALPLDPKFVDKVSLYQPQDVLKDGDVLKPAKYSGYINSSLTAGFYRDQGGIDYGTPADARLDSAVNLNGYVVESGGLAQSNQGFQRDDVRLTKQLDNADKLRISAGDLYYPVTGFQTYVKMGGVAAYTNNNLYHGYLGSRVSQHQIEVKLPSTLTFFVNGQPVATKHFLPGVYDISDIPLVAGTNQVKVIMQADGTGQKETVMFDDFFSEQGITQGKHEFAFAVGNKSTDTLSDRTYDSGDTIAMGNYRFDYSNKFSLTEYFQANTITQLMGSLQTFHVKGGYIELDEAASNSGSYLGLAGVATYYKTDRKLLSLIEGDRYSFSLNRTAPGFTQVEGIQSQGLYSASANYTFPTWRRYSFGVGSAYSHSDFIQQDSVSYSGTISRSFGNFFVAASVTQSSGQVIPNQTMATLNVNWTPIGDRSIYYNSSQLGQNQVNNSIDFNTTNDQDIRGTVSKSSDPLDDNYAAQVTGTTNRNEMTVAATRSESRDGNSDYNEQFTFNTRFALAFADSNWAIGRPIEDSFFITNTKHDDYEFQAKVNSRYSDTGPMGEAIVGFPDTRSSIVTTSAGSSYSKDKSIDASYTAENTYKNGYVVNIVRKIAPTTINLVSKKQDETVNSSFTLTSIKTGDVTEYFVSSDMKVYVQDVPAGEYEYSIGDYRGKFELKAKGGEFKLDLDN